MNDLDTCNESNPEVCPPRVSILIPVHNQLELTRACLDSVFDTGVASIPFEVIVIDDSTEGRGEYLTSLVPRVRLVRTKTRKSFGEKINLAAPMARGEYLCLLNNDTLVTAGWLEKLMAAARTDPRIAVVGNRHLTPETGLINHGGMVINSRFCPVHLYRVQPADFGPALISREFQILTAACWLVSKRTFLALGSFDPQFHNGFEDVDFCLRARQKGYKVFYAADSVIYHHGLSTPGRTDHETSNAENFKSKWGAAIRPDIEDFLTGPAPGEVLSIKERISYVEKLRVRRPLIAGVLLAVIRLVTSVAKRL